MNEVSILNQRRAFTPEFKLEAVDLVLNKGYSVTEACDALDIGPTAMRRWVDQYKKEKLGIIPEGRKALTPEQRQIQALQKRVDRLELEKDILKNSLPGAPRPTRLETLPLC